MELREDSFNFPPFKGSGPRQVVTVPMHRFPRRVLSAVAGITGYSVSFDREDDDHEWGRLQIELSTGINPVDPRDVEVSATFGLRDHSGDWDDSYSAVIQYVVLAELEPVVPPGPGESRGDLIIVDAEFNQATQHFRSDKHLNAANVFPDNSIRLIANKPTGVRLYVDYDVNSGLAPITTLSGEVEVTAGAIVQTITPWNVIAPRRDTEVDRTQVGHTVNFTLPESLCTGSIRVRAKVFSAADPTQFSATFERTLTFIDGPAIPVFCVGINYTGTDVKPGATPADLAAPPQSEFTTLFTFMEQVYPIPGVTQTGYMTMDYSKAIKSDITKGCDKFDDLLEALRDLRGDATDFFFGLINVGVDRGTVGGCGTKGDVCAGTIGRGDLAGHEMGHVFGRKHAPCDNVTRCKRPLDTDDDYPQYAGYPSDSIGEHGFDTSDGSIRDPAMSFDVIGYSKPRWIGPYTYKAVMSRVPIPPGTSVELAQARRIAVTDEVLDDDEWILVKRPHLFIRLSIARDRTVIWHPAFHFPTLPQAIDERSTDFTLELVDAKGNVLGNHCLFANATGCGCCNGCAEKAPLWPLAIRQAVPFDETAAELRIYECDKKVWSAAIPAAPRVKLTAEDEGEFVHFQWKASSRGIPVKSLWYLLQWQDRTGTWRGCAPRTQAASLRVPKRLFGRLRHLAARVLATSGIATGTGTWEGPIGAGDPGYPPMHAVEIQIPGVEAGAAGPWPVKPLLRVTVVDRYGRSPMRTVLRWYRDDGTEIGRGRSIDLRRLPLGMSTLRAVVLDSGTGMGQQSWRVERTRQGTFLIHGASAAA